MNVECRAKSEISKISSEATAVGYTECESYSDGKAKMKYQVDTGPGQPNGPHKENMSDSWDREERTEIYRKVRTEEQR